METKITSRTDNEVQLTISLNEAELKHVIKHVYDELRPRVKAAGFRPGKAPDAIVEREMGSGTVQGEVIEHAVQDSYVKAIRAEELPVVAPPQVQIEKFVPYTELSYKVTVEVMPKVKLADYASFRIDRPAVTVDAAEIDTAVTELRQRDAEKSEVTRAAQTGDEVVFDFHGTKDGQDVDGASAEGQTLKLGSGQFIPGFEEELVGLQPGTEKTFDIRFPETYHEKSLAGEVVTFAVKLHTVTELALPELTEAFIAKVGPFKTEAELRANLAEQMTMQKAENASRLYEQAIMDRLVAESELKAPEALVRQQLDRLKDELQQNLSYSGLDLEKYLTLSGKDAAGLEAEMRPEAEKRVALAMILTEVATAENITVSEADLDAEITRMKGQYRDEATQKELDNPTTREEIYNHLMASRVLAKLVSFAEQSDKPAKAEKKSK